MTKTQPIKILVPKLELEHNLKLAITGSCKELDQWKKATPMNVDSIGPYAELTIETTIPFEFKFVLSTPKGEIVEWEEGLNRIADNSYNRCSPASIHANRWRTAGTAIPVFSIRTEDDFGIGEFNSLKKLIDWAEHTGQKIIQLLPINDTTMTGTWQDSYPYNANSTFALHPQFIHLPEAGVEVDKEYNELKDSLNSLEQVDYERVNNEKDRLLRKAFDKDWKKVSARKSYKTFLEENSHWLISYAAFRCLTRQYKTADFSQWEEMAVYSPAKLEEYKKKNKQEIAYHCFVQYHLHTQMTAVKSYAHSKGVMLKGDLPIGISRTSVDAWIYPELFHLDSQAGAPPDAFSADGQNWGFPTYNWEKMAEDGFSWWKARLHKMSEYFDAFRIDHILGFFRIWEIPLEYQSGIMGHFNPALPYSTNELMGAGFNPAIDAKAPENDQTNVLFVEDPVKKDYWHPRIAAQNTGKYAEMEQWRKDAFNRLYDDFFYHRHNEFWKESAYKKLPSLLSATKMLACGEDLGMIPACVPDVMKQLQILSLEIQRMPKSVSETFANPAHYPYLSVCTTSTHDMNPLRAWWEEDRSVSEQFYRQILGGSGDIPYFCEPWICLRIIEQHLKSPAMFTILPIQDWLSLDGKIRLEKPDKERINIPAISHHYWRYRMHLTVEDLLSQDAFNTVVTELIKNSGR